MTFDSLRPVRRFGAAAGAACLFAFGAATARAQQAPAETIGAARAGGRVLGDSVIARPQPAGRTSAVDDTASPRIGSTLVEVRASEYGTEPCLDQHPNGLLAPDRLQHASLAFSIGLGAGLVTEEPAIAAAGALGLGLVKELFDRRAGRFDPGDLLADLAGAALAALATRALAR